MARPREFDETAALDAAIDCFWRDGYEATSVRDLAASMGITGTSLYNAFGDKRSLFRQALQRYAQRSTRERIARLESTMPPKQAVCAFLGEIVERSLDDRDRRGCLLVNSALEVAPHDPELGAEVAARLGEIEAFFRRSVTAAQADGSVPPDRDPADLARLLLGVTLGVRVLARSKPQRELLEGTVRPALTLLDWPDRAKRS
ncbi:MAG TPA: TetR/AcrR family transcriptional regulator [Stellaceae bacterium]|jgi:TetR/AcrR family transcriptional repressor of nem operon|nr:TetR/AcrR family transcriptional regulator [Stellaceae bacterium]